MKSDDVLGLLEGDNYLNPYVSVGNSHSVEFLEIMEKVYEKRRRQQIRALEERINENIEHRRKVTYEKLIEHLELIDFGRYDERSVDTHLHNNGEWFVKLLTSVRDKSVDVVFLSDTKRPNDNMMELSNMCDAIARAGAEKINVYIPFIPGQREDKKDEGRVPISARLIFKLIESACDGKLNRIITSDLHAAQAQGFTDVPVDNLYGSILFARYIKSKQFANKYGALNRENSIVIAPDVGRVKAARGLAELLNMDYLVVPKKRKEHGESEIDSKYRGVTGEKIKNKDVFLIEDMADTGGTLKENGEMLKEFGVKRAMVWFTHLIGSKKYDKDSRRWDNVWHYNIVSNAEDVLRGGGMVAFTTDSISTIGGIPKSYNYYKENKDWLGAVISLAPTYAEVMLANRTPGGSVSYLINRKIEEVREAKFGTINMSEEIIFE